MHIVVLCATKRGYLFLNKLIRLNFHKKLTVFSFREEVHEPPFLGDIKNVTESSGGTFFETKNINSRQLETFWSSTDVDLMFAVNWRYIVPPHIFVRPCLGTYVFHDSLLPAYRGFSPTVWAMINGEKNTGVTLFKISEKFDEGDIIAQKIVPIYENDTIKHVTDRVTETYLDLLEQNIENLCSGTATLIPQEHHLASYTVKRLPKDNFINWNETTDKIYNLIRAVTAPYPGAFTFFDNQKLTIWSAKKISNAPNYIGRIPGRVVDVQPNKGTVVATGDGTLLVEDIQLDGHEIVNAAEVLKSLTYTLGR